MIRIRSSSPSSGQPSRAERAPDADALPRTKRAHTRLTERAGEQRVVSIDRTAARRAGLTDRAAVVLVALLAATACRLPPVQSQARAGDFVAVRETLSGPEGRKTDVGRLAREVLGYEIRSSKAIDDRPFIA